MSRERFAPMAGKSGRDPSADRLLVHPEEGSKLGDLVGAMDFDAAEVDRLATANSAFSIRSRMSSTFQAVVRGPSFTGFGKRPVLIPAHHVERPTGIGPFGARMEARRTKPERGRLVLGWPLCCIRFEFRI